MTNQKMNNETIKKNENKSDKNLISKPAVGTTGEIEVELITLESEVKSIKQKRNRFYGVCAILLFIGITFAILGSPILKSYKMSLELVRNVPLLGIAFIIYALVVGFYMSVVFSSKLNSRKRDIDVMKTKKRIISRLEPCGDSNEKSSYFDRLVEINISNLEAYYRLVKEHTNNSFLASVTAGAIGFILICCGLVIGFTSIQEAKYIAYLSAGSGVLTEFIASIFFYLYNRTVRQLKDYHDSLIAVQNILLSFKIVGDTKDQAKQSTLMELMLKCLIKIPTE